MAKYTSKYEAYSVYTGDKIISFIGGHYETEDKEEIKALDAIQGDIVKVEEKQKPKEAVAEESPKSKASDK